jgi:hypothetical protein
MMVIALLVVGSIWFIQSPQFAKVIKRLVARNLPGNIGIEGDFSELAIKFFPPGIAVKNPRLNATSHNIAGLQTGTSIAARELELTFLPFQMFSGNIRVNQVTIVGGDVFLPFKHRIGGNAKSSATPSKISKTEFHWDELLQVHAEAIALEDTKLRVEVLDSGETMDLTVPELRLGQWQSKGMLGYEVTVELSHIGGTFFDQWPRFKVTDLNSVKGTAQLNAEGLKLGSLSILTSGVEARASGLIKGDVLANNSEMNFEMNLDFNGKISEVNRLFGDYLGAGQKIIAPMTGPVPTGVPVPVDDGKISFTGKCKGDLLKPAETMQIQGELNASDVHYKSWVADQLQAVVDWDLAAAPSKKGEVTVHKIKVIAKSVEREGALQAGSGGRIEVDAFKFSPGSTSPFKVPVKLEGAHIHWFTASQLQKVYPLTFRATGPIELLVQPSTPEHAFEMKAHLTGFEVNQFQLDNQHLGKVKPLMRVLHIPKITLDGDVAIDANGVRPQNIQVSLPHTKIHASGKVDFNSGFDLFATGNVNMADIGQIVENPIGGEGTLNVHVHGPSSSVQIDFDTDLKKAFYLDMFLGDMKGTITWDDDPDILYFKNITVVKGQTNYVANGSLHAGEPDSIDLNFAIPGGDIQDFTQIFTNFTKDMGWFPRSLNGPMSGSIHVFGGLRLSQLKVFGTVNGKNWEYLGERFRSVDFKCGYDQGSYFLNELRAVKHLGKIIGKVGMDPSRNLDWELHTESFGLSDIDHFGQLDVPVKGAVNLTSSGKGKELTLTSTTNLTIDNLAIRGQGLPSSQMSLKSESGVTQLNGTALGGQGTVEMIYDAKLGAKSYLRGELKHLDFSPILLLINPELLQDHAVSGIASGEMNLTFESGSFEHASGKVGISEYVLAKSGAHFELAQPIGFKVQGGTFDLKDFVLKGDEGLATLNLKSRVGNLEGTIAGDLDASIVEFFTSTVARATGTMTLDLAVGGTLKSPTLFGRTTLEGVAVKVPALDSPIENITGNLLLKQNVLTVQNIEADLAGGRLSSNGTVTLFTDRYPTLNIKTEIEGAKLKIYPFQYVRVTGEIDLTGEDIPYLISGTIAADSGLIKEKVFGKTQTGGLKATRYLPPVTANGEGTLPKFKLRIAASAEKGILIQNDLFINTEAKGDVTVVNTLDTPRIIGTASIIQGKMVFKEREFQIQSASADFDNPQVINPSFTFVATTDVSGTKIQLYISGRLDKMKAELTANPTMSEPDILSLLTVGLTSTDTKKYAASSRSALDSSEAASLVLNSLDFNREVQTKTGFQVQLDQSINSQVGQSVIKPQVGGDSNIAPRIVIRKQINEKFGVGVGTTVGVGTSSNREVNGEYKLNPTISVLGVWDDYTSSDPDTPSETSVGMDLKFQKRFK